MMMNTSMMKKNSFKSVSIELYTGGNLINDNVFNILNDITDRDNDNIIEECWQIFYNPISSRVVDSRFLIRNITLEL
jgi:hypothetical protein